MKTNRDWQFVTKDEPVSWPKTNRLAGILFFIAFINLLVIIAAPLCRLYLNTPGYLTFRVMFLAIIFGLLLSGVALIILIISKFKNISPAAGRSVIILLLGIAPPALAIAHFGIDTLRLPLINDISTDTVNPPEFQEVKNLRSSGQNSVIYAGDSLASLQHQAYPEVQPIITRLNRPQALDEVIQVVKDLRWEFINIDFDEGIIEAYDTSQLFGFTDDIIIRVRTEGRGSRVDIRSSSRVGNGDLGKNAERIRQFINTFRD